MSQAEYAISRQRGPLGLFGAWHGVLRVNDDGLLLLRRVKLGGGPVNHLSGDLGLSGAAVNAAQRVMDNRAQKNVADAEGTAQSSADVAAAVPGGKFVPLATISEIRLARKTLEIRCGSQTRRFTVREKGTSASLLASDLKTHYGERFVDARSSN